MQGEYAPIFCLLLFLPEFRRTTCTDTAGLFVQNWHLVLLWEYLLSVLGVQYTSL